MPLVGAGGALSFLWFIFIWAHVALDTKLKRKTFWIPLALLYDSQKWCEVKEKLVACCGSPLSNCNSLLSLSYSLAKVKPIRPHCWLQGFREDQRRHRMVETALNFVWQLAVFEGIKPIWGFLQLLAAWSVRWEKYLSRNKYFLTESTPQKTESWLWRISED